MSHLHNVTRPFKDAARIVHAVTCDCPGNSCGSLTHQHQELQNGKPVLVTGQMCTQEFQVLADPEYEWYVPLGWSIHPDGTHRCPDCRTKAAVERDHKEQAGLDRPLYKVRQTGYGLKNWNEHPEEHHHVDHIVAFGALNG